MNEQTRGLSRRSFLTGAAGMGALAALGLTGCAAPKNAAERSADAAGEHAAFGSFASFPAAKLGK